MEQPIDSYKGWRIGLPPQWYPTHSNAYYVCVTGGSFTEVSCMGIPSVIEHLKPENNPYKNAFGTEIALFRTSEGGMARMAPLPAAPIPAGGALELKTGGAHAMFDGLTRSLSPGDTVGVRISFARAGTLALSFPVEPYGGW
jgi:hypothetical protein